MAVLLGTLLLYFTEPTLWDSSDYALFYRPNFQLLHDAIWSGGLPLWNPFVGLGRPFLADTQNAVFYPPLWLVVIGPNLALVLLVWAHNLFALLGMRRFAVACGAGEAPAWIAAVAFVLSGPLVSRWTSGQILYCCAMAYVPSVLQLARGGLEGFCWRRIAWLAAMLSAQFLCGHPQIFWVTGIGAGLYLLGRGAPPFDRQALRRTSLALGQLAMASLWAGLIVGCVLLPFTDLIAHGNRADSATFAAFGKLPASACLSLFGTLKPLWEYNLFLGWWLALPGLAGLALVRDAEVRAWWFVGVFGALIALGDSTPFFDFAYRVIPGLGKFRFPARMAMWIPFGLILTGALWLTRPISGRRALMMMGGAAAVSMAAVAGLYETPVNEWQLPRWQNLLFFGLPAFAGLLFFALRRGRAGLLVLCFGALLETGSEAWSTRTIYGMRNVSGLDPTHPGQWLLVERLDQMEKESGVPPRVLIDSHAVPENYGMIHGYSSPDAYTSLFLKRPWDYLHGVAGVVPPKLANTYLSYEVYKRERFLWRDINLSFGLDREAGEIVSNPKPSPRAYLSFATLGPIAPDKILATLTNGHSIHVASLVEAPLARDLPTNGPPAQGVPIGKFSNNRIELEFESPNPALLVLAEVDYPGWRAEVNGKVTPTLTANYWMRAVEVPAGKNRVVFSYRERLLPAGMALTFAGLLSLALTFWRTRKAVQSDLSSPPPTDL
jgi:hypothetical protein